MVRSHWTPARTQFRQLVNRGYVPPIPATARESVGVRNGRASGRGVSTAFCLGCSRYLSRLEGVVRTTQAWIRPGTGSLESILFCPLKTFDATSVETGSRTAARFTPCQFGVLLGLFILALFPDVASGTNSFFYRDFGVWAYPDATYHRECFWRGELPLWNPYNNCGLPFLAQWNPITLYPLSLIYLLLPLPWSLNLFCLIHLWLAGMGMHLLARRWTDNRFAASVAGMAYALNGLTLHSLMWPNNLAALGWLPLVVLFVERAWQTGGRWIVFAAIAGASQMLAGAPEIILLTWFAVLVFGATDLMRKSRPVSTIARRFGFLATMVALLCAIQLLPFLELMKLSQRTVAFGDSTWSMPAWGWANYLVPLFHQSKSVVGVYSQDAQQWTSSYYAGIGVVFLAAVAILRVRNGRVWILGVLALFALFLSMGEHSSLYRTVKSLFPQMGFFRFPIKFVVLVTFALPLLAAYGVQPFQKDTDRQRTTNRVIQIIWLGMLVAISGIVWVSHREPVVNENWSVTLHSGLSRCVFLTLIAGALLSLNRIQKPGVGDWIRWAVLVMIGLDAATHTPQQNPTVAAEALRPKTAALTGMPGLGEGRAMVTQEVQDFMDHAATANLMQYYLGQRRTLLANCNLIDRIPKTDGFYSLYLREEAQVQSVFRDFTNRFPSGLADFLGVSRISSSNDFFGWTTRSTAFPMITAGQRPIVADAATTLTALMNPQFDARAVVYLPEEDGRLLRATNRSEARIEITQMAAHRIEATVDSTTPGLVVAAQAFAPAWRAYVNGRAVPLFRANHAFQAIEVPEGHNAVTLLYRDWYLYAGTFISVLTLAAGIVVRVAPRR